LNPNACGGVAKHLSLIRRSQNDREVALANILYQIQIGPNGREVALVRSLEHVHRLVGLYLMHTCEIKKLNIDRIYYLI